MVPAPEFIGAIACARAWVSPKGGVKVRAYEMMFILKPDLEEEQFAETKDRLKKIIADFGGEFIRELDGWGKKRLAYAIQKYTEGVYSVWHFNGQPETVQELDRVIKISDRFLRHIIVRQDEK